ncbi:O-antigen ligase family protein [Paludicola sp. MB14-C6]|uniref:O-antigen ligase family protein n=1 Tax=Paludihabitans sp. MB14-C6 TaxID=3070656 RepID=UPI0027DE57E4|nr:O-antigen ligase family protein [Paludicola sp. MB14-C6]WMJ23075.1 O-antigen ligase family protein [Paludicola sp. MB14-C6]
MIKTVSEWIKKNWLVLLIVAQPLLDILAYWQQNSIGTLAGVVRLCIVIALPIYILVITKKKKSFILIMGIMAFFSLLHIVNGFRVGYINMFQDIAYLLRVIQMPVLAVCFIYYFNDERKKDLTNKAFVINGVIIFVSMIIAHLTNTAEYSYGSYKFGLMGWFSNANSQSIIIISLIPIVLYFALSAHKKIWFILAAITSWFMLISNGTKACYLSIFVIFIGFSVFMVFERILKHKEGKKLNIIAIAMMLCLVGISVLGYEYTPRYDMDNLSGTKRSEEQTEMDKALDEISTDKKDGEGTQRRLTIEEMLADPVKKKWIVDYYGPKLDKGLVERFGVETVLEAYGWTPPAYRLADMRLKKITYANLLWESSDFITKLVGFEYSDIHGYDLENDWPAIYFYYGYLGLGLYVLFILAILFFIIRRVIKDFKGSMNLYNFALLITFGLQIGLAQFSGAILRRPNVSIYMAIIIGLIYYQTNIAPIKKGNDITGIEEN